MSFISIFYLPIELWVFCPLSEMRQQLRKLQIGTYCNTSCILIGFSFEFWHSVLYVNFLTNCNWISHQKNLDPPQQTLLTPYRNSGSVKDIMWQGWEWNPVLLAWSSENDFPVSPHIYFPHSKRKEGHWSSQYHSNQIASSCHLRLQVELNGLQ